MEKEKMLGLMRFWLFGTFLIIFVAATLYLGAGIGLGAAVFAQARYWIAVLVAAVLCVIWYYIYKWYLDRKE
ncbi:MAG: hypothetical protein U9O54_02910 [Chloroflexota bacterium]|nr:hypothetical protein [Chloroflexota bacterium]